MCVDVHFCDFFQKGKKTLYIYIYIRKDIKPSFCLASRVFCFTYLLGICLCTHLWFFFQNKKHYIYKRNDIKPSLCLASRDCASYIFRHLSLCAILHVCEFFSKKINNKTHTHTYPQLERLHHYFPMEIQYQLEIEIT